MKQHNHKGWKEEIIDALIELGGHGTLSDIAEKIKDRGIMNPIYESTIRSTIYSHSSDGTYFKKQIGGEHDIFYSVKGIGQGHWGLRNFEPNEKTVDLTEDDMGFPEGKKKLVQHVVRERNPQVIKLAKERFKHKYGKLFCEVCNFDFKDFYGELGEDYIEGHHIVPISELDEGQTTKVDDIVLVCSNCHRMLHRKRPWLGKVELKEIIKNIDKNY